MVTFSKFHAWCHGMLAETIGSAEEITSFSALTVIFENLNIFCEL